MISLRQVTYIYPNGSVPALRDLSLAIPKGQFCGVVGRNGSGKSTLAYMIAGFIPHFFHGRLNGDITVAGNDVLLTPLSELVRSTGLVLQNPFNQITGTKFTVREEVAFGLENLGVARAEMYARVEAAMLGVGIHHLADRSPLSLSGGQMQRVAIASILVMRPSILVLDEPTSQLDPAGSREVLGAIRQLAERERVTVVIIEHKLEWLAVYADRIIALADGALVADGEPAQVLTDASLLEDGLGQTRYTQVSRRSREIGLWPQARRLAVTLEEAVQGFSQVK
jgi:energy-coupling factor transporter ATP-binding protein EcfA2